MIYQGSCSLLMEEYILYQISWRLDIVTQRMLLMEELYCRQILSGLTHLHTLLDLYLFEDMGNVVMVNSLAAFLGQEAIAYRRIILDRLLPMHANAICTSTFLLRSRRKYQSLFLICLKKDLNGLKISGRLNQVNSSEFVKYQTFSSSSFSNYIHISISNLDMY